MFYRLIIYMLLIYLLSFTSLQVKKWTYIFRPHDLLYVNSFFDKKLRKELVKNTKLVTEFSSHSVCKCFDSVHLLKGLTSLITTPCSEVMFCILAPVMSNFGSFHSLLNLLVLSFYVLKAQRKDVLIPFSWRLKVLVLNEGLVWL